MATSRKRDVTIDVVVDDRKARAGLKGVGVETGKLEGAVGKLRTAFSGLVAIFGAREIVRFAGDMVEASSDLNESLNAVNVTFEDSAEGIKKLGEGAAEAVGLSNAAFNSFAVGFSAFAEAIAAASGEDVVGVIDELTVRIADFASVMNLDVTEAADKFRAGLAGETEPLRKFGIDVSAATVTQRALELGLAGTSSELTEQDKILARYSVIMEQTDKVAGDFANTSGELANQTRITNAQFEDVKAELGEHLIPIMSKLMEELSDVLGAMQGSTPATGSFAAGLENIGDVILTVIERIQSAVEWLDRFQVGVGKAATDWARADAGFESGPGGAGRREQQRRSGGRARGGPVGAGETYLVGEEGPELLHMGSGSGSITPNDRIGQTISVTVNGNTDPNTLASLIAWKMRTAGI
jgi:hypothetical protein